MREVIKSQKQTKLISISDLKKKSKLTETTQDELLQIALTDAIGLVEGYTGWEINSYTKIFYIDKRDVVDNGYITSLNLSPKVINEVVKLEATNIEGEKIADREKVEITDYKIGSRGHKILMDSDDRDLIDFELTAKVGYVDGDDIDNLVKQVVENIAIEKAMSDPNPTIIASELGRLIGFKND